LTKSLSVWSLKVRGPASATVSKCRPIAHCCLYMTQFCHVSQQYEAAATMHILQRQDTQMVRPRGGRKQCNQKPMLLAGLLWAQHSRHGPLSSNQDRTSPFLPPGKAILLMQSMAY
jgi:alkylated DNA repair dioxygenase AlkB